MAAVIVLTGNKCSLAGGKKSLLFSIGKTKQRLEIEIGDNKLTD